MKNYVITALLMAISLPGCSGSSSSPSGSNSNIPGIPDAVGLGICEGFYSNSFAPVTGKALATPDAALQATKPDKGERYEDPSFKTCVVRATNYQTDDTPNLTRTVPFYARSQAFNADSTRYIVQGSDGNWHLYKTADLSYIRKVLLGGSDIEINWHPTDPNILYKMGQNGGTQILSHDISDATDSTVTVVADLTDVKSINGYSGETNIQDIWPGVTFSTGSEGSASGDNRYWALMSGRGLIVVDIIDNVIAGVYDFATDGGGIGLPNNVSMSPGGEYVVALWNPPACAGIAALGTLNKPCGTMVFNRSFSTGRGIAVNGEHGDTAVGADGQDVYVGIEYQDQGAIEVIDLATGNIIARPYTDAWAPGAFHFSGRAVNNPGWIIVSSYGQNANNGFDNRIMAVTLTDTPEIVNLAHHYSTSLGPDPFRGYFSQPHATVNRQGTKILFGSDWGDASSDDADTFLISIPDSTTNL